MPAPRSPGDTEMSALQPTCRAEHVSCARRSRRATPWRKARGRPNDATVGSGRSRRRFRSRWLRRRWRNRAAHAGRIVRPKPYSRGATRLTIRAGDALVVTLPAEGDAAHRGDGDHAAKGDETVAGEGT